MATEGPKTLSCRKQQAYRERIGEEEYNRRRREISSRYYSKYRDSINKRNNEARDKYRKENPKKYLFALAQRRSKSRGQEFTITLDDLPEVPDVCPLLGVEISSYSENADYRVSIDRIDSSRGYVPGNVWFVSHRANRIKSDATAEELLTMAMALFSLAGEIN